MDTDVLVVGAGPTGLMLANQLVRRGVRVRIIDRHAGPALQTRALGVQARTLEIYAEARHRRARAGARQDRHRRQHVGARHARWRASRWATPGARVTPYPYILILGQDDNERIMGEKLRELGVAVQWNTELVGLEQQPDGVAATLKLPDGTQPDDHAPPGSPAATARAAPCASSTASAFPGAPYEHVFFVADVEMTGSMVPTRSTSICGATAFICCSRCAARITGASSASCRRLCAAATMCSSKP